MRTSVRCALPLLLLLLLPALPAPADAAAPEAVVARFERGIALYEQEDFDAAAEAFEEVLAAGAEDAAVHYNLANSYFKSGRLGLAIFHYRRAHVLAPRDEDIAANLEYARFLALDSIEEEGTRTDLKVESWLDRVTPAEAFRVPLVLWLLAGAAAVLWQLAPAGTRLWRRSAAALAVLWALSLAVAITVEVRSTGGEEAVVLAPEIPVRNGPGESFDTAFVLHEGAEVVVEGDRGGWTEISLPGDLRGWIDTDAIARL
jgi:tetratricopeptide (TPR) repeat protein